MQLFKSQFKILVDTFKSFNANRPVAMAGTTAYFAIFSMGPILIIIISVFGFLAGDSEIRVKLFHELGLLIGQDSTQVLQNGVENYQLAEKSKIGTIIGIGLFLLSATTLFKVMQDTINQIWRVKIRSNLKSSIIMLIRDRILSFGVIMSLGFILLISLVIDAGVAFLRDLITTYFSERFLFIAQITNAFLSLAIVACIFTILYRYWPDVKVRWSASWYGGIVSAVLFTIGKIVIGIVVGNNNLGAVYGAASSIIAIMLWVYYASLIFYFGVELTRQFSIYHNHENKPLNYAVPFKIIKIKEEKEVKTN